MMNVASVIAVSGSASISVSNATRLQGSGP